MIQKKICLLGGFGVGKTSLVSRFVHSMFSDKYLTTIGVKIEKKSVELGDGARRSGRSGTSTARTIFRRSGCRTCAARPAICWSWTAPAAATLDTALALQESAEQTVGEVPVHRRGQQGGPRQHVGDRGRDLAQLTSRGWPVIKTSAKTGVARRGDAFAALARAMVAKRRTSRMNDGVC